jgi:CHAT domain-containing protein
MPRNDLNHYWVEYSSEKWDSHTIIESTTDTYKDAEDWASKQEEENVQVWEIKPVTGICAAILGIING